MEKLNKYPKYKPSGVEWIGEIPEGWNLTRTKWVFNESKLRNRDLKYEDKDLLSVSEYYGVAKRTEKIDNNEILNRAESLSENMVVKKGELVINIMLAWKKGLGISFFDGIVSPSYCVYKLILEENDPNYFHYLYRTDLYAESFRQFSRGIIESRLRLYTEEFFNIISILPLPEEQTAIANFLDDKTAKIDTLIEKKKNLIQLLKEERTSVINQAVTGHLSPFSKGGDTEGVLMKPSGIDWLGTIPEHWEVKKLKYVGKINASNKNYNFNKDSDKEVVFLPMEKVSEEGKIIQDIRKKISEVSTGYTYFERDDVIVAKITPCFENGKSALLTNLETDYGFGSTEFHTIRATNRITKQFLFYVIKSERFMTIGEAFMAGSAGQKRVPTDFVKDFITPIPPINEQSQIVQLIETETQRIDSTISKIENEIELLKEYRTALISEVVTGKIKVS